MREPEAGGAGIGLLRDCERRRIRATHRVDDERVNSQLCAALSESGLDRCGGDPLALRILAVQKRDGRRGQSEGVLPGRRMPGRDAEGRLQGVEVVEGPAGRQLQLGQAKQQHRVSERLGIEQRQKLQRGFQLLRVPAVAGSGLTDPDQQIGLRLRRIGRPQRQGRAQQAQ
nr:hypothetical protein [Actinoplanes brasiliensis]